MRTRSASEPGSGLSGLGGVLGAVLVLLLGCGSGSPGGGAPEEAALQPGVDVLRYVADLNLEPEKRRLAGTAELELTRPDTLTRLRLFLAGMTIDSVRASGRAVSYRRSGDTVEVELPAGETETELIIAYQGVPTAGLYRRSFAGQPVVFTDSWPTRARHWLPSVDVPSDPARFSLELTVPAGYETVANGVQTARRIGDSAGAQTSESGSAGESGGDGSPGTVTTEWSLSAPAPTYSLAFAVGDFAPTSTVAGDTLAVDYYLLDADSAAASYLSRTPESLAFLRDQFGAYSYDNYQVVQVPIQYGGMENAALPFLNAELFRSGRGVESTQIHEAVHMWFGDRVVLERWRDLWLSEGVATYYTTRFYEHADGREEARRRWVRMVDIPPEELEKSTVLVPDRPVDPNAFLTWVPYQKGASVLHLLRRAIGDEPFAAAMRETYRRHRDDPITTPEFRAILEEHAARPIDGIFDYWVYGDRLPTLRTSWSPETRRISWTVEDDAGTLEDVPFELQVRAGDSTRYVPAASGSYAVPAQVELAETPRVRPVGILMHVAAEE